MKKVILLSGSPKRKGNSILLLEKCEEILKKDGIESEIVSLAGKKIESCNACGRCKELKVCSIDDGLNDIIAKLREADGFITVSPVYLGTARGDMMSALHLEYNVVRQVGYLFFRFFRDSWKDLKILTYIRMQ
jgi:multimeric flavodoxin WrbA